MLNFLSLGFKIQPTLRAPIPLRMTLPKAENFTKEGNRLFSLDLVSLYARFNSLFSNKRSYFFGMLIFRLSVAFMLFVLVSTVLWIYYCLYLFRAFLWSDGWWTSSLLRSRLVEEAITRKPCEYDGVVFCCVLVFTGFPMVPILPMTLSRATLRLLLFGDRRVESTFHLNTVQKELPLSCYVPPGSYPTQALTADKTYNNRKNQLSLVWKNRHLLIFNK